MQGIIYIYINVYLYYTVKWGLFHKPLFQDPVIKQLQFPHTIVTKENGSRLPRGKENVAERRVFRHFQGDPGLHEYV